MPRSAATWPTTWPPDRTPPDAAAAVHQDHMTVFHEADHPRRSDGTFTGKPEAAELPDSERLAPIVQGEVLAVRDELFNPPPGLRAPLLPTPVTDAVQEWDDLVDCADTVSTALDEVPDRYLDRVAYVVAVAEDYDGPATSFRLDLHDENGDLLDIEDADDITPADNYYGPTTKWTGNDGIRVPKQFAPDSYTRGSLRAPTYDRRDGGMTHTTIDVRKVRLFDWRAARAASVRTVQQLLNEGFDDEERRAAAGR